VSAGIELRSTAATAFLILIGSKHQYSWRLGENSL
jgi:hypothetical protein